MAIGPLRPDPTDTNGLVVGKSSLGRSVVNCRIWVHNVVYIEQTDTVEFTALYFWDASTCAAWIADRQGLLQPFLRKQYSFTLGEVQTNLRTACFAYLATLDPFNGVDSAPTPGVVWIYT